MNLILKRVVVQKDPRRREAVDLFLHQHQLSLEADCEIVIVAEYQRRIVGCGAIAGCVLKCIAVDPSLQGEGLSLKLLTELMTLAYELGRSELFLFTKPDNAALFSSAGFWPIARAGDQAVLMENSRERLARYCRQLTMYRQPGEKIGAIVMNANPFTLGHRHLVEQAATQCDALHLFVVREDASFFPFSARIEMVRAGVAHLSNVVVHEGSQYIISRATFPAYFLKETGKVQQAWSEIDVLIFRDFIAPALGITHRFIGSEPFCDITRQYNQTLHDLLASHIDVVEMPRIKATGNAISASEVRRLLKTQQFSRIREIVPDSTFAHLEAHYRASAEVA